MYDKHEAQIVEDAETVVVRSEDGVGLYRTEKATQQAWAFTIKKLGGSAREVSFVRDYVQVVEQLKRMGYVKMLTEESDSDGRLHIHGIILLRKGFMRKRLCFPTYHTYLVEIYDEKYWIDYIHKEICEVDNRQYMF